MTQPNTSGVSNLVYDLELDRWVTKKDKESASTKLPPSKRSGTPNNPHLFPSPIDLSTPSPSSSNDPVSSLFAERAARFTQTEASARQADIDALKAAEAAEQARLRARRERVERLAKEKLEDSKERRGKEWDRKLYEEKVRAQAVMEVERKKQEDIKERERIKRNIADDEERRRLARERMQWKYGRRLN